MITLLITHTHTFSVSFVFTGEYGPSCSPTTPNFVGRSELDEAFHWGVDRLAPLPSSYLLLKAKKQFQVARPIISYRGFIFSKLFRCVSFVLDVILRTAFPDSFGLSTLPRTFRDLHAFLQGAPLEYHLEQSNQDLIGFLPSIPASRILESVQDAIDIFMDKTKNPGLVFSVFPNEKDVKLRVFQGVKKGIKGSVRLIPLKDVYSANYLCNPQCLYSYKECFVKCEDPL